MAEIDKETEAYLARIRKTISDSKELMSRVELRIGETDRLLAEQGVTREQLAAMTFTEAQRRTVNEELRRRGLSELDEDGQGDAGETRPEPLPGGGRRAMPNLDAGDTQGDLENRRRKFNVLMREFRL